MLCGPPTEDEHGRRRAAVVAAVRRLASADTAMSDDNVAFGDLPLDAIIPVGVCSMEGALLAMREPAAQTSALSHTGNTRPVRRIK